MRPRKKLNLVQGGADPFSKIKIRSNVPLPSKADKHSLVYGLLDKMKPGDSFETEDADLFQKIYTAVGHYGKKNDKTFARRKVENGFGLWRIK